MFAADSGAMNVGYGPDMHNQLDESNGPGAAFAGRGGNRLRADGQHRARRQRLYSQPFNDDLLAELAGRTDSGLTDHA